MAEAPLSPAITLDKPANPGLDYEALVAEGIVTIQALAGKVWTDYNEHDPGVTSLEQLCYALTDLSYRAEMPMASLLSAPGDRIDTRRQALFVARHILPVNPVTQDDYRRLIVDRVPEVANVWLTPLTPVPPRDIDGLYAVQLYVPGLDPCFCEGHLRPEDVLARVRRVYSRHRGLCEDVESISVLEPIRAVVAGIVTASDQIAPEQVMSDLLWNLSVFFAPEVKREPLSALVARGESPSDIFDGPLPHNGFVEGRTLGPKPTSIEYDEVIRVMVSSPGVLSVRGISVRIGGQVIRASGQSIAVPRSRIPVLETGYEPGGKPTLKLFRRGKECTPDPRLVRAGLRLREAEQRRLYPLGPEYEELFQVPAGPYRDLSAYTSIQSQYPACYGINAYGVPEDYPALRKAQAKQLKGYLLAFEQVLTDYFAQLAHARDLFSTDKDLDQTYWAQSLLPSVPNVAPILMDGYEAGLQKIVRDSDPVVERRNLVSEFLLAMFQEQLDTSDSASDECDHTGTGGPGREVLEARLSLLAHLPASTKNRGRGFDYLAHPSPRNIAGMEIKSRIQLGMPVFGHRPLRDVLENVGLVLVGSEDYATLGGEIGGEGDDLDFVLDASETGHDPGEGADPERAVLPAVTGSLDGSALLRMHAVTEATVRAASRREHYRIGTLPGERSVSVVCKAPGDRAYRLVAKCPDERAARSSMGRLAEAMAEVSASLRQLYIIEHILLRDADLPNGSTFPYSFTITAVIATPESGDTPAFRDLAAQVLRENAPAHVAVDIVYLTSAELLQFETRRRAVLRALRRGDEEERRSASNRLVAFLRRDPPRAEAR